jgi:hypothetical protein
VFKIVDFTKLNMSYCMVSLIYFKLSCLILSIPNLFRSREQPSK